VLEIDAAVRATLAYESEAPLTIPVQRQILAEQTHGAYGVLR
jgi:hypothetical protein